MTVNYRRATPDDIASCIELRGRTRENAVSVARLAQLGITHATWSTDVATGRLSGHVCVDEDRLVGYCFGDTLTGEVAVLALLPEWEGRGIGKHLLTLMVDELGALGFERVFLGTSADPDVRSYGFYRHLGWTSTGAIDSRNDEVLEYFTSGRKRL